MPHLNYDYKLKKVDRNDYQAIFMLNQNDWKQFKEFCQKNGTTPSKKLRDFVKGSIETTEKAKSE